MKFVNKIRFLHSGRTKNGTIRPCLVIALSILLLTLAFGLGAPQHPAAAELSPQEAAVKAKELQLEGTQLQLKGSLEEAVLKYKESISYKPNPGLERLVGNLEKMIVKKEQAAAAEASPVAEQPAETPTPPGEQAAVPEPTPEPQAAAEAEPPPALPEPPGAEAAPALPESGEAEVALPVPEIEEPPFHFVKAVLPQRTPASPEEEMIYGFTDWLIGLFPARTDQSPIGLKTEYNYAITAENGGYVVSLGEFVFYFDEQESFNLSPLVLHFQPQGTDKLAFQIQIPEKSLAETAGQPTAELTIAERSISGVWNQTSRYCDSTDLKLGNILFKPLKETGELKIEHMQFGSLYTKRDNQLWDEQFNGTIQGIALVDGKESLGLGDITLRYSLDGADASRYEEIRKSFPGITANFEQTDLAGYKDLFQNLDAYFQLLNAYDFQVSMQNFAVETNEDSTKWDTFSLTGNLKKDPAANIFTGTSEAKVKGIAFTGKPAQEGMPAMSFVLDEVLYGGKINMKVPPPTLFTDFFAAIEAAEKAATQAAPAGQTAAENAAGGPAEAGQAAAEDPAGGQAAEAGNAVEAELARQGLGFTKAILGLFKTSSFEFAINGLAVDNAMPGPVRLKNAKVGGGFDVGSGEGGTVHGLFSFSGLNMGEPANPTMPQAATVNFALAKIPSLLELISDPSAIAEGDLSKAQGEVMLNAMNTFMTAPMILTLKDSFVAFPNSGVNLDLALTLDSASKFMSTGTVTIAVENPDDLMQVAQALGADPDMQRMLTTLTAVSNRTEEKGKIVDRVEARLDPAGKVFVNAKDVTLLFFPEPPATTEPATEMPPAEGPVPEEAPLPEPGGVDEKPSGN